MPLGASTAEVPAPSRSFGGSGVRGFGLTWPLGGFCRSSSIRFVAFRISRDWQIKL